MLMSDRTTPLPVDVARELRDALCRKQKELPSRWLAAQDAIALRHGDRPLGHPREGEERELALALLRTELADLRPRGIICLGPSASGITASVVEALSARGSVTSVAVAEVDHDLSIEMVGAIARPGANASALALACDYTVDVPLPAGFPRPRVYLCLGNTLGSTSTVGAVRMLRVLRTTMIPGDHVVLGLDVRPADGSPYAAAGDNETSAARHFGALQAVQSATGAALDPGRFDFRPSYDTENCRLETHLVARRAFAFEIPGVCDVRFRKGESLRTSVRCTFDRNRVSAMLAGVGLSLRAWTSDDHGTYVVALAAPAS